MSVPSAPVSFQVRMTKEAVQTLMFLTEEAIQRAIQATKSRLQDEAYLVTPVDTGLLLSSFDIASTPRSIVMKWSATDPKSGYNYATVADVGRPAGAPIVAKTPRGLIWKNKTGQWRRAQQVTQGAMAGAHFSDRMRERAHEILIEELMKEIENLARAAA